MGYVEEVIEGREARFLHMDDGGYQVHLVLVRLLIIGASEGM